MKIKAITKSYGGRTVLSLPELELEKGRVYAVIGANGSGKSSFAKVLSGVIKTDEGISPLAEGVKLRYMPQKSYAFRMKVQSNLSVGGRDDERAAVLLGRLGLSHLVKSSAKKLSGGESSKMALARVLMQPCELLILDEPTASLDMPSTLEAERLIAEYAEENKCTVLLITHSIRQAQRLSHEILFLSGGKLIERGSTAELLARPSMEETKAFLEF